MVRGNGDNVSIINVQMVNPYQAVDFATNQSPPHYVRGLHGQPPYKGIWVDECYDIGRIQDVHFWPSWTLDQRIVDFTTTKGTLLIFKRTDWEVVEDVFRGDKTSEPSSPLPNIILADRSGLARPKKWKQLLDSQTRLIGLLLAVLVAVMG